MATIGTAIAAGVAASPSVGILINTFGSITSLASGSETLIVSFTVPIGKTFFLQRVECSGTNHGTYSVFVDSVREARRRTFFTEFNTDFEFNDVDARGLSVSASKVIEVKVIHTRPFIGDFDARIVGVEV